MEELNMSRTYPLSVDAFYEIISTKDYIVGKYTAQKNIEIDFIEFTRNAADFNLTFRSRKDIYIPFFFKALLRDHLTYKTVEKWERKEGEVHGAVWAEVPFIPCDMDIRFYIRPHQSQKGTEFLTTGKIDTKLPIMKKAADKYITHELSKDINRMYGFIETQIF